MQDDPVGLNYRRLTMAFTGPGRQYQFSSIKPTPDGKWALVRPGWIDGVRPHMMLVKIPSVAKSDGVNRADFIRYRVDVPARDGATHVRIRFGYAENGPPSSYFCTSRQEACLTDAVVQPFAYQSSDTLSATSCLSDCTVRVPALSGRVLYYQKEWLDASGNRVHTGPREAYPVP